MNPDEQKKHEQKLLWNITMLGHCMDLEPAFVPMHILLYKKRMKEIVNNGIHNSSDDSRDKARK